MFALFAAPPERDLDWQEEGVSGVNRFLGRVYRFVTRNADLPGRPRRTDEADRQALRKLHQTISKITDDFDSRWHFNTSIASLMELVNELYSLEEKLSPAALRESSGSAHADARAVRAVLGAGSMGQPGARISGFPRIVAALRSRPRQGRLSRDRGAGERQSSRAVCRLRLARHKTRSSKLALDNEKVQPFLEGKQVVKTIVVPDKLVNIVVR